MNKHKGKIQKKTDIKDRIIKRQIDEIEILKKTVSDLKIDNRQKDELVGSINNIRNDLMEIIDDLEEQRNEYVKLNHELIEMRNVINATVFKGKWKLIRWLIK